MTQVKKVMEDARGRDIYVSDNGDVFVKVKTWKDKFGYECVTIAQKNIFVHRLVASAFVENENQKDCINHKNGIKTDNYFENLEWVTKAENNRHAFRTGLNRKGIPVECMETGEIFTSCRQAAKEKFNDEKLSEKIRLCIHGKRGKAGGLHWRKCEYDIFGD